MQQSHKRSPHSRGYLNSSICGKGCREAVTASGRTTIGALEIKEKLSQPETFPALIPETSERVAFQTAPCTPWTLFGPPPLKSFRWKLLDRGLVPRGEKEEIRHLLLTYAKDNGFHAVGDIKLALQRGNFWISLAGGVSAVDSSLFSDFSVTLSINALSGHLCTINAEIGSTVASVKLSIQGATGIPASEQDLIHGKDSRALTDYSKLGEMLQIEDTRDGLAQSAELTLLRSHGSIGYLRGSMWGALPEIHPEDLPALIPETSERVAYQTVPRTPWRLFGSDVETFRWKLLDPDLVPASEKEEIRQLLLTFAQTNQFHLGSHTKLALRRGMFWISLAGGISSVEA